MATYNFNTSSVNTKEGQRSLLAKSFLYMFIFLMVTAAVAVGLSLTLYKTKIFDNNNGYFIMLAVAGILQIVLTIVIVFTSLRPGKASVIPMTLYAVCMGILLSSFTFALPWYALGLTFAISALCFGAMAIIGATAKNASGLGIVGFGLLISVMLAGIFNVLLFFLIPGAWGWIQVATSSIIVIAIMLITAYDVWQIKAISARFSGEGNLAFYLAFNLYLDFIIILIHLLRIVIMFIGNSNR